MQLKSAYSEPQPDDGLRFLVDRLWPRGVSRERLQIDGWLKDLAPSDGLRRWFAHDPEKWEEFRQRYFMELDARTAAIAELLESSRKSRVTLVFAARDRQYNNAVALREYLQQLTVKKGESSK